MTNLDDFRPDDFVVHGKGGEDIAYAMIEDGGAIVVYDLEHNQLMKLERNGPPREPAYGGNYPYNSRTKEAAAKKQVIIDIITENNGGITYAELQRQFTEAGCKGGAILGTLDPLVRSGFVTKVDKGFYKLGPAV
jgi:hypothetical protein